jgi:hypothetical protein
MMIPSLFFCKDDYGMVGATRSINGEEIDNGHTIE